MDEEKKIHNESPVSEPSVKAPRAEVSTDPVAEGNVGVPTEPQAEAVREEKEFENAPLYQTPEDKTPADDDTPLDKNVKLMSPARMVVRRFFRSKLSIVGLVMLVSLLLFCFAGPLVWNKYQETYQDPTPMIMGEDRIISASDGGETYEFVQVVERRSTFYILSNPSAAHPFGTDKSGHDILIRLMKGGQRSLGISFIAVFTIAIIGIIFGGIAGYFGGWVDNLIMRICDILMCLPGLPLMLIIGTLLDALDLKGERIYFLMMFLTIFSWSGTARLVRGQLLFLREQEYMVAAEAMGFSAARKIFKHLVPNVLPQLIVSMSLSLGSMILYESSLSYLGLGTQPPFASWGAMVNDTSDMDILENHFNVWGPPGVCIIIAVLGFNFIGDGLRDALDPKMRR